MVFLRDLINNLVLTLLSIIKVILLSSFNIKIGPKTENTEELLILANGPSLRDSFVELTPQVFTARPLMCVNNFCFSPKYEELKPHYYIMNAPEYWMVNPPTQAHIDVREKIFKIIIEKTCWELVLFVPVDAKSSPVWKGLFDANKNVKVEYYNNTGVEGFSSMSFKLMDWKLGMPRPHNVLTPSIYVGLQLGFKKIFLLGADHSWHEELRLDENNYLIVNHEHFYDSGKQYGHMHKLDGAKYHIHDVLRKLYLAFLSYFTLNEYARSKGAVILNASKKSYIDAFDKIKL